MASNHTNLQAIDEKGQKLSVQHTSTDSPILPAANLQQLSQIDPALVQWVVRQTELEADARRRENSKVNWFIFIERMSGVLVGGVVAIIGFLVGGYLVMRGHDWAGVALCGTTLATIVTVIVKRDTITRGGADTTPEPEPAKPKRQPARKK